MAAIGTIRNKFGWFLVVIMVISLIAFLLMGVGGQGGQNNARQGDDLAIVNGEPVSNNAFTETYNTNVSNYRAQAQQQNRTLTDADLDGIKKTTYDQMVLDKLFDGVYSKIGVAVCDEEMLDMVRGKHIHQGILNSFKDSTGVYSASLFTNFINNLDIENNPQDEPGTKRNSWVNYELAIKKERLQKKYSNLVESSITVPTFMAKDEFTSSQTLVSFSYVKVPYSSIADSTLNLSDSDLNTFLNNNAKQFQQEESVDIKFASFKIVASENDIVEAENWINKKTIDWKESKKDSLFMNLHSATTYDGNYYSFEELNNSFKDSIFASKMGTVFGPKRNATNFESYKLIDRKLIPDSLQARHLLISLKNVTTQEEAFAKYRLFDSLYNLVDSAGYDLKTLTAQYSDDFLTKFSEGDLSWIKPNQKSTQLNNLVFFDMKQGETKKINDEDGLHIVQVYNAKPTKLAVKVLTLRKEILASSKTQENIYADASRFSGNMGTKEKFESAEETTDIYNASFNRDATNVQRIQGNSRQIIKWAFKAKEGDVSNPFSVDETYYVALLVNKNEKGLTKLNDINRLRIETAAAKAKKAELIKNDISGTDLNAIATAKNTQVKQVQNLTFANTTIENVPEPKVVGLGMTISEKTVSKPIDGFDGVYVISVTSKTAPADDDAAINISKKTLAAQQKGGLINIINNALIKSAEIKDNRFDFF